MADLTLPVIDEKKCTVCGLCVDVCPEGVLTIDAGALTIARPDSCTMCAECEGVCPENAVSVHYRIGWAKKKEQE